uniref:Reverse transcriptase domain-containing protein n=1 Tax=Globisporangium ultimum (strain ATCC 200006 / CBS 805.95 / DAOM BR144) TaxID=431595 RepID=K3WKE3_GLOUD
MQVLLQDGSRSNRCGTRKYPERQRKYLREYVKQLEKNGLVRCNNQSRRACAALPVKKGGQDDIVNKLTIPIAGATPNLAAVTQGVKGALLQKILALPLHPYSQEYFSFVTGDGVFTPTRVPQEVIHSAIHFQLQMHAVVREMLYEPVLVWINGALVSSLKSARSFRMILRHTNLKLNTKKCMLSPPECNLVREAHRRRKDRARPRALVSPAVAACVTHDCSLHHFICTVNWVRESMVYYARMVGPLKSSWKR